MRRVTTGGSCRALLVALMLMLAISCTQAGEPPEEKVAAKGHGDPGSVFVKVDGEPVTLGDILRRIRAARGDIDPSKMDPDQWQRLLEATAEGEILDRLLLRAASTEGLEASGEELDQALARSKEIMGEEKFGEMLDLREASEAEYREFLKKRMLIEKFKGRLYEDIAVGDEKVREYYEGNKESFTMPDSVRIEMIIVEDSVRAEEVYRKLKEGSDFKKIAEEYSVGYERGVGGESRWLPYEALPSDLEPLVRAGKAGETLEPVDTGQGAYIIRILETRPAGIQPFEEVKGRVRDLLVSKQKDRILGDWYEQEKGKTLIEYVR